MNCMCVMSPPKDGANVVNLHVIVEPFHSLSLPSLFATTKYGLLSLIVHANDVGRAVISTCGVVFVATPSKYVEFA